MVYDAARRVVVLFGGNGATGALADTWEYDGSTWTQDATTTAPSGRYYFGMAWLGMRGRVTLFSGTSGNQGITAADTWELVPSDTAYGFADVIGSVDQINNQQGGLTVTARLANGGPTALTVASDDPTFGLLFQDASTRTTFYPSEFTVTKSASNPTSISSGSSSLLSFTVASTSTTARHLFVQPTFAVAPTTCNTAQAPLELWVGACSWRRKYPLKSPESRDGHCAAPDPLNGRTLMFGGEASSSGSLSDTWSFDGSSWTSLSPASSPPGRRYSTMVYDSARAKDVLFGGIAGTSDVSDTWTFDGATWQQQTTSSAPGARRKHALVFDSKRGVSLLYGGVSASHGTFTDTWMLNGSGWTSLSPATTPSNGEQLGLSYDAARDRSVLFGGVSSSVETWEFNGTNWSKLSPSSSPPTRFNLAQTYDPARHRTVMFGGRFSATTYGDTWEFDGTTWTQLMAPTKPSGRDLVPLAYGPNTGRSLVFGGESNASDAGSTWLFSFQAAGLKVLSVGAPATIIRGQKGISVKARILNGGEHSVNLSSSSLQLTGPGGVSTTGGFTITPSPANVSIISGSSTATLAFTLDSNPTTQLGAMTIQATVSGTDALSGGATSDSTAETPGSWSVLSPASLVVNSVTLSAASALPGTTGIVVAGGQVTLRYSVSVLASARLGVTTIDATVTVKDKVTGASPTKTGVDAPGLWTVRTVTGLALGRMTVTPELAVPGQTGLVVTVPVQNAGLTAAQLTLSITSPAAGAIVFAGDPIPFAGTAIDDANVALDPALLTWRSNLSGTIGAGTHFTRSLPVGVHTITFNASNGSTLSGSTSLTLNVRSAPTSADTLSISGSLLAIGTGSPVADGFRVTFTNARGGSSATGVTTGGLGHYSAVFSGAGVANVGDSLAVAVTSADGRALAATPAALALSNQDILTGNRAADLSVAVSPEAVLALRSGLNLVSLAVRPTTTGGDALTAADLAAVTGSTFVIRAARGRFEAYLVPSGSGAFALEGSQGYFIFSPSTRTLHLSGTPWDASQLVRDVSTGINLIGLPRGAPSGFSAADLLGRVARPRFLGQTVPAANGSQRFATYFPGLGVLPFPLESGRGYLLSADASSTLTLPGGP